VNRLRKSPPSPEGLTPFKMSSLQCGTDGPTESRQGPTATTRACGLPLSLSLSLSLGSATYCYLPDRTVTCGLLTGNSSSFRLIIKTSYTPLVV